MVKSGSFKVSQGSLGGRIGEGLGKGLAESIPKEVDRYRLSQGLKNIQNKDLSPIDQLSQLYQSGASPEQINQIIPYLRNAAITAKKPANSSFANAPNGNSPYGDLGPPTSNPPIGNHGQNAGYGEATKPTQPVRQVPSLVTAQGEAAARTPARIPHPDEIDNRARQLMSQYPELYQGENAYHNAYARASDELNYPLKIQQEQQSANTRQEQQGVTAITKLLDKTAKKTQKKPEELFSLIPGEAYQRSENRVRLATSQGVSTDQATDNESDYLKNLGKNITTLRNNIAARPFFGKVPSQTLKDVENLKPFFEKNGELELFKDEIKGSLDIGDHLASFTTWRPNKSQEKVISDTTSKDTPEKIASRLYPTIDDKTSLFSLGYLLNKVGADDQEIVNQLVNIDNGFSEKKLNDRQTREGSEYYPLTDQMGDLFYTAFIGFQTSKALVDYITGRKEKVGPIEKIKRSFGKE